MNHSTKVLSVLAVAFVHTMFAVAVLHDGIEPRWVLLYFTIVAFYGALYFRRRLWLRDQCGGLYYGLGYAAVVLGALQSALFFYSIDHDMPLSLAIGVWLGLAIAAYFLYRVIVLHLEEEVLQAQVHMRAPV